MAVGAGNELAFTGERLVPGVPGLEDLYFEHITRYLFAESFCRGRDVLDAGSGAGYGAHLLASRGARRVLGVDRASDAVLYARSRYDGPGVSFTVGDLLSLPVQTASFDVVVCFEAIEHVPSPEQALAELARVLRPDGTLILSTPNREVFIGGGSGNPFHTREFTTAEFRDLLRPHFPQVRLYAQRPVQGLALWPAEGVGRASVHRVPLVPMDERGIQPPSPPLPTAETGLYLVAVCDRATGGPLDPGGWFFPFPLDVLSPMRQWALSLQRENEQLRQRLAAQARLNGALLAGRHSTDPVSAGRVAGEAAGDPAPRLPSPPVGGGVTHPEPPQAGEAAGTWDLLRAGWYREAYERFERLVRANPGDARVLLGLGLAAEGLGAPAAATLAYRTILSMVPGHPDATRGLTRVGGTNGGAPTQPAGAPVGRVRQGVPDQVGAPQLGG